MARLLIGELKATTVRVSPFWRPKNRSNELICQINVTGFASVMLVFLFVFMSPSVGCPPMRGTSVDLPKVATPTYMRAADRDDALMVAIQRDGKVYFRTDPVSVDQLSTRIRLGMSAGAEKKVYIKADARSKYGSVAEVLDAVHEAGIEKIGFLVDQRHPPQAAP